MPAALEFTGERFLPGAPGDIAYEHWHRYAFALRFATGRRILDAACGEGYGTALLAGVAASAIGLDVDPAAVDHARSAYAGRANLRYEPASVAAIPLPDDAVDVVVSFETIEHLPAADQPRMIAEFARVLAPGGLLVISSPNKKRYSDDRGYSNPFHLHELQRDEFSQVLAAHFPHCRWFHQAPLVASAIWGEAVPGQAEAWTDDGHEAAPMPPPEAMYYVVVAARAAVDLPEALPALSVFADRNDTEMKRVAANATEVLRLDALLRESNDGLARQQGHIRHLEELVSYRDRIVGERDAQLAALNATLAPLEQDQRRLEAALAAQERLIAYHHTLQWWLRWPVLRLRLVWQRWTGRGA